MCHIKVESMKINYIIYILFFLTSCGNHILTKQEERELKERQTKCEVAVSNYIKKYAQYPMSYESIEFSEYTEMCGERNGVKIPNSEDYIIFHRHKLKDLNGQIKTFAGYFYVTYDFLVGIIEIEKSNSIKTWPPETKVWTSLFGRPLNAEDSLEISIRTEKVNNAFLHNLKEDFKIGNKEKLNAKDEKLLKNLLDTVK
jgi:hypothetical protein